ncbi:MAG: prepilin peptidase [Acidobacteria bacterium]|nr:prepilin peptidase [Acidobacteriota bacterium]
MNSAFYPTAAVLMIAAITDIRSRRIPNWLVVPFLAVGILVGGVTRGPAGVGESLAGVATAVALAGVLCYLRGMGLGDLKLCAAVGAWIGPAQMVSALVVTAIAGGVIAVAYALWHRSLTKCLDGTGDLIAGLGKNGFRPHETVNLDNPAALKMPYALAIAVGTMFSFYMQ